jgi:DNA polymerase delta subunit 1
MNTDVDYYIHQEQEQGIIRLYGVTEEGYSVVAHIHNFESYFWAECPRSFETEEHRSGILKALNVSFR